MPARYNVERIQQLRADATSPRRLIVSAIPAVLLLVLAVQIDSPARWVFVMAAAGVVALAALSYNRPRRNVASYDRAHALWDRTLDASDPKTKLTLDFPLRSGEIAYYSEMSTRFGEATGAAPVAVPGSHVDPEAIPGLRARFGPSGSVYYGPRRRRGGSRRARPGGLARVVPVDSGRLSITNQRFLFEGDRESIELPIDASLRLYGIENTERIAVERGGIEFAHTFSVDPMLFNLAMIRRAGDARFVLPPPPPPLGFDQALIVESAAHEELLIS